MLVRRSADPTTVPWIKPLELLLRIVIAGLAVLSVTVTASAQVPLVPTGLGAIESERSRTCVDVLSRLDELDRTLSPMAERSQRLLAVAEAIALEDRTIMESLDQSDPIESRIHAWFVSDGELAQRYIATLAQQLVDERATAREAIKVVVSAAIAAVQTEADQRISATGDLAQLAAPCDGAIFVRSAVLEACEASSGPLCDEAALEPSEASRFRFVDSPEAVWDIQEIRPWTNPAPLQATPDGQLDGARTVGFARSGNVVISVAFSPLIRDRQELTPEETRIFQVTNDSLGIQFTHPDLAFAPALGIRATLPMSLGDESTYVLHFGTPEAADVLWTGTPGTGAPIEGSVPLGAAHVGRLQAGEPITFTALRSLEGSADEPVFTIELTSANQAQASQALVAYMAEQLGRDLAALVRPRGSQ